MTQEIITYIIISSASVYTLYSFVKFIIPSKNKSQGHSCSGGCSGCAFNNKSQANIKIGTYS